MPLMQITVIPLGTGSTSVGDYVADIQQYLLQKGAEHSLHDMGTIIHGSTEELLNLAGEIHNLPFAKGVNRVVTQITLDDRRDVERKIGEKEQAVAFRLQRKKEL